MTKSVHTTVGVGTFLLLSVSCPDGFEVASINMLPSVVMVTSALGSILPDFDMKPMHYSQGKKGVKKKIAQVKTKAVNAATGGHRGITHTLLFPALLYAVLYFISTSFTRMPAFTSLIGSLVFGVLAGWVLHIFADLFNGKGAPILWPFVRSKLHIMDCPSEGIGQWLWCICYLAVVLLLTVGKEIL